MGWHFLNSYDCFKKSQNEIERNQDGYTIGYCTGNILILVLSIISLVYCTTLMIWNYNSNCFKCKGNAQKSWIFTLMTIQMITVVLRYLFNLYGLSIYPYMQSITQLLQSIVIYLVCNFFAIKSVKQFPWIKKAMQIILFVFLVCFVAMGIYQTIVLVELDIDCR